MLFDLRRVCRYGKLATICLMSLDMRSPVRGLPPLDVVIFRRQPAPPKASVSAIGDEKIGSCQQVDELYHCRLKTLWFHSLCTDLSKITNLPRLPVVQV
jgi:hypothetical protein